MKRILWNCSFLILIITTSSYSQDIYNQRPAVSVNVMPVYENWSINDSSDFSEFTNIISAGYNPFDNTSFGLVTRYASANTSLGNINSDLSGLSDIQLFVKQKLPDQNLSFDAGINVPSGKTKLSPVEFAVTQVVSQELFGLKTPNFGQGLNLFAGTTWLHQLSEEAVIGAGISYQIKSEYQPLNDVNDRYKPSNEISVTAGLDLKLSETQTISGDIIGIFYGSDKLNGSEVFATGSRIIFNSMYKQFFAYDFLTISLLYRNVAIDELKGQYAVFDNEKITPNQFYAGASYNQRFNSSFSMGYGIFSSFYEKTAGYFSGYTLYGLQVTPQFQISPSVSIPLLLKYAVGSADGKSDLSNYVIGGGIRFNL